MEDSSKIFLKVEVEPVVLIGQPLQFRVIVHNGTDKPLRPLKVYLKRQNIFAGYVVSADALVSDSAPLKLHQHEQTLKLLPKLEGEDWPLEPGRKSILDVEVSVEERLSPSVARTSSWNAFRQYALVVTASSTDVINRKKASSAAPLTFVHSLAPASQKPGGISPGTFVASLAGPKSTRKVHHFPGADVAKPAPAKVDSSYRSKRKSRNEALWEEIRRSMDDDSDEPNVMNMRLKRLSDEMGPRSTLSDSSIPDESDAIPRRGRSRTNPALRPPSASPPVSRSVRSESSSLGSQMRPRTLRRASGELAQLSAGNSL